MEPSFLPEVVAREIAGKLVPTVDARQLHAALRVNTRFATWIARRTALLGLVDGEDYASALFPNLGNNSGRVNEGRGRGAPSTEYALTTKAAKRIAMSEGGKPGKAIQEHFIRCEERLRDTQPDAHAESVDRMREEAGIAGVTGDAHRATGGSDDPGLVARLAEELLEVGRELRDYMARETQAFRDLHAGERARADALEAEMRRRDAAWRAATRAKARKAADAARYDAAAPTTPDWDGYPAPPLDEAGLEAVLADLPTPDLRLRKRDAGDADRGMALRLAGCPPIQARPFRFWRAEHGSPGINVGKTHVAGRTTRNGVTYEMRRAAVRIFDALQERRRALSQQGTRH